MQCLHCEGSISRFVYEVVSVLVEEVVLLIAGELVCPLEFEFCLVPSIRALHPPCDYPLPLCDVLLRLLPELRFFLFGSVGESSECLQPHVDASGVRVLDFWNFDIIYRCEDCAVFSRFPLYRQRLYGSFNRPVQGYPHPAEFGYPEPVNLPFLFEFEGAVVLRVGYGRVFVPRPETGKANLDVLARIFLFYSPEEVLVCLDYPVFDFATCLGIYFLETLVLINDDLFHCIERLATYFERLVFPISFLCLFKEFVI